MTPAPSPADSLDAQSPERLNVMKDDHEAATHPHHQRDVLRQISMRLYVNAANKPPGAVAEHVLRSPATRQRMADAEQVCAAESSSLEHEIAPSRKQHTRRPLWMPKTQDDSAVLSSKQLETASTKADSFLVSRVTDPTSYFFRFHVDEAERRHLAPQKAEVQLVDIAWLKPHEQIVSMERVDGLRKATISWDAYTEPLLVDINSGAILDGHHRYTVGLQLHLKQVPAVLVDYLGDDTITVDVWPGCGRDTITKREVIAMALSPNVFPPKTSRHRFTESLPPVSIPLSILRQPPSRIVPTASTARSSTQSEQTTGALSESDASASSLMPSRPTKSLQRRGSSLQQISIDLICGAQNLATSVAKGLFRSRLRKIEAAAATTSGSQSVSAAAATSSTQLDMIRRPVFDVSDFFNAIRENDPTSGFCRQKAATFEDLLSSDAEARKKFYMTRVCDPTSYFFKYRFDAPPKRQPRKAAIHLAAITWLKAHEHVVSWERVDGLRRATVRWDAYLEPLLVDVKTGAILDGHHRYHVGKQLSLTTVPVVLVDYLGDESITVDVWPECGRDALSKHEVIAMALSDELFPPKTSRHTFSDDLPPISVPLARLREPLDADRDVSFREL